MPEAWSPWAAASRRFRPGDAVFGDLSSFGFGGFGAFAEYVCAPESSLLPSRRACLSSRRPHCLRRAHDGESRRESDLDGVLSRHLVYGFGGRFGRLLPGNGVAAIHPVLGHVWITRPFATSEDLAT